MKKLIAYSLFCSLLCAHASFAASAYFKKLVAPPLAADTIKITNAEVSLQGIDHNSTEATMVLDNTSNKEQELIAAFSPVAKQILLHKTIDKKLDMEPVNDILIPAHREEDLSVQAFHIMLIDLQQTLTRGTIVPLTLLFKDGSWLQINAPVT